MEYVKFVSILKTDDTTFEADPRSLLAHTWKVIDISGDFLEFTDYETAERTFRMISRAYRMGQEDRSRAILNLLQPSRK